MPKPQSKFRLYLAQAYAVWAFLCLVGPIALLIVALALRERSQFTRSRRYRRIINGHTRTA